MEMVTRYFGPNFTSCAEDCMTELWSRGMDMDIATHPDGSMEARFFADGLVETRPLPTYKPNFNQRDRMI